MVRRCERFGIALLAALLAAASVSAQQAPLRILASNGVKAPLEALHAQLEKVAGRPVSVSFDTSSATRQRIAGGEAFDVAVLTSDVLDELTSSGQIAADSRAALGKSGIGIGARAGGFKPDITTPDAIKHVLLAAQSLTWASDGASRPHITGMLESLGIADALQPRITMEQGSVRSTARVARGDAQYVITLVSEILPVPGIELVGLLPSEYQHYVSFSAGASAQAAHAPGARAVIALLAGPDARPVLTAKGIERP